MSFLSSPGVHVREIDLTNVVPSVATTVGAIVMPAEKGPVSSITTIGSEQELVQIFGEPQSSNFEWWFTASNFLQYSDQLKIVRAESGILNAGANSGILIRDDEHYEGSFNTGQGSHGEWAARTAGTHGNSLGVTICPSATAYEQHMGTQNLVDDSGSAIGDTDITVDDADKSNYAFNVGDIISFSSADSSSDVTAFAHITGDEGNEYEVTAISTNSLSIRLLDDVNGQGLKVAIPDDSFIRRRWAFYDLFDSAPGQSDWSKQNGRGTGDELHVVVYDSTGDITGYDKQVAGSRTSAVIETFANLSKNPIAKTAQGGNNYYPDVIFRQSNWIYWTDHLSAGSNWGTDVTAAYTNVIPVEDGRAYTNPEKQEYVGCAFPTNKP